MKCINWIEKGIKNFKWYDISLIKLSTLFATLFLIVIWNGFRIFILKFDWYWYLILTIIFAISPMKKLFK